jgi:RNA polymerase sigma factor (sigma-70 family)
MARGENFSYDVSDFRERRVFTSEMNDAIDLLKRYGRERDEEAFRELVARFFGLVHGAALRRLNGDDAAAMDVTQIVFADLARKAAGFPKETLLGGWLHSHTCFVASKHIRSETRRVAREQEAASMNDRGNSAETWRAMSPVLDEALHELSAPDRSAILLRFFEGHDLRSVGAALRVSEDAAQKRVERALERLKTVLETRGVTVSVVALGGALAANGSSEAAVGAIQSVASKAMSSHAASGRSGFESTLQGVGGKLAAVVGCLVLLFFAGFLVKTHQNRLAAQNITSAAATTPTAQGTDVQATADRSELSANGPSAVASANANDVAQVEPAGDPNTLVLHVLNRVDQKPIAGVTIRVSTATALRPTGVINPGDAAFNTDAKGIARIAISDPPPQRLLVETWASGFSGWLTIWDLRKGETIPREYTMLLEPGVLIGGRVVDGDGKAIEGAAVRLTRFYHGDEPPDRSNSHQMVNTVTNFTDAAGDWSDNHVPETFLESMGIRVSHENYATVNAYVKAPNVPELRARTWTVTLTEGTRIAGRVTTKEGAPIEGAQVAFGSQYSANRQETQTDNSGQYELKNLTLESFESANVIAALAPGYMAASANATNRSASGELNFVLEKGASIRGRVVNTAGEPIRGASVSREPDPFHSDGIVWSGKTDDAGRFVWDSAPSSPQSFYIGMSGYAVIRGRKLAPGPDEHKIVLSKRQSLRGTVKNAATGAPVPEFFVMPASGSAGELSSWSLSDERNFKNGVFEIELGEVGYSVARIRADGFFTQILELPPAGRELVAELKPSPTLQGVVLDRGGQPVRGVQLAALGKDFSTYVGLQHGKFIPGQIAADNCITDDNGTFKLPLSAPAETLVAAHPAAGYAEAVLSDATDKSKLEIRLQPWGRVEGVIMAEGAPLPGAEVMLNVGGGLRLLMNEFHMATDDGGRFAFDKAPPRELSLARMIPINVTARRSGERTNFVVAPAAVTYVELHVEKNPKPDKTVRLD